MDDRGSTVAQQQKTSFVTKLLSRAKQGDPARQAIVAQIVGVLWVEGVSTQVIDRILDEELYDSDAQRIMIAEDLLLTWREVFPDDELRICADGIHQWHSVATG